MPTEETQSGLPGLQSIPLLGWMFGRTNNTVTRKELIVLISPRIIRNSKVAREVTQELRDRLRGLRPIELLGEGKPAETN